MKTSRENFEQMASAIHRIVASVLDQGFQLPLVAVSVGANGSINVTRLDADPSGDGLSGNTALAEYPPEGFAFPLNILIADTGGRGQHFLVEVDADPVPVAPRGSA